MQQNMGNGWLQKLLYCGSCVYAPVYAPVECMGFVDRGIFIVDF